MTKATFIHLSTVKEHGGRILRGLLAGLALVAVGGSLAIVGAQNSIPAELTRMEPLGKLLFFDTGLSTPPGMSCAICHEPSVAFTDPRGPSPVSAGVLPGRFGNRNSPSAAYAAFSPPLHFDPTVRPGIMEGMYVGGLFWDGRADTLEEQAWRPC
jgi:cytochrome c peroxidase